MSATDTSNINSSLLHSSDGDSEGNWKVSDGGESKLRFSKAKLLHIMYHFELFSMILPICVTYWSYIPFSFKYSKRPWR